MRRDMLETVISDAEFIEAVGSRAERVAAAMNEVEFDSETEVFLAAWRRYLDKLSGVAMELVVSTEP